MEKFLFQNIPEELRHQYLKDNCENVEKIGYTRHFSPEELNQKKEQLANTMIQINDIEEEKAEVMAEFKEQLKPLTDERKEILEQVKKKSEYVEGNCYKFVDHEEKIVGYYDRQGVLVNSRPIMPHEMQKSIFSMNQKTGTDE